MKGETVIVVRSVEVGRDPANNPITEESESAVEDVLVAPGPLADAHESNRPKGVEVRYTLHFPKTYDGGDLTGASIKVRGEDPLAVVGSPRTYTTENTPTRWNMPVEVGRVDG